MENMYELTEKYCKHLGIPLKELTVRKRSQHLVDRRHLIYYMLRKAGFKTIDIAGFFGNKSHATVVYGVSRVVDLLDIEDPQMRTLWEQINTSQVSY